MAEDKKTAPKLRKIADVANPGETAPSPNSKSVIISHHPTIQDPMVTAENQASTTDSTQEVAPAASPAAKVIIQPLADSELLKPKPEITTEPAAEDIVVVDDSNDEIADDADQPTSPAEPESPPRSVEVVSKAKPITSTSSSSSAIIGTKDIQSDSEVEAAEDAEAKRQAELAVMIADKRFYLSINTAERQRTMEFIVSGIVLSLLLGLIWVDIALDAGIIHIGGLKALTHFFN